MIFCSFHCNLLASDLPPLPEPWKIQINDVLTGIESHKHWLDDYIFSAPARVKPGQPWIPRVEATWRGPSLVDRSLLTYIQLEFTPLDKRVLNSWSGDKILYVSSYNENTNKIVFEPTNTAKFLISPQNRLGVYNHMFFTLRIGDEKLPMMYVSINTRTDRDVEVTCSDGLFCNGEERFIRGECKNAKITPCTHPTNNSCMSYNCVEEEKRCESKPIGGSKCNLCSSNSPQLNVTAECLKLGNQCGWNQNHTLFCGDCSSDSICFNNRCILKSSLGSGSCNKPWQLWNESITIPKQGLQGLTIFGDLSNPVLVDHVTPVCNVAPVVDAVYVFKIEINGLMGVDIQMLSASGTTDIMDTVLAITDGENCGPLPVYSFCSDDASPPGGVSSRVFGLLSNGTYKLVASAFSSSPDNLAPFQLRVKFYPNCIPQCEGNRQCGPDGCGGLCGECSGGTQCDISSGQCRANPCVPQCSFVQNNTSVAKTCGDDGCDGVCGSCYFINSEMCDTQVGLCRSVIVCNNLLPECEGQPPIEMESPFCASDCQWHDMKELPADVTPAGSDIVLPSIEFDWRLSSNQSCAGLESCFKGDGYRLLMRFDSFYINVGMKDIKMPTADEKPLQFQWSTCHGHFHYDGFGTFNLYDFETKKVLSRGSKMGYCLEDISQLTFGEHISCNKVYDCNNQGMSPGWGDLYTNVLDCQWLDVTDVPHSKWYIYEICWNSNRKLSDFFYSNDCRRFAVYLPNIQFRTDSVSVKYADALAANKIDPNSAPKVTYD